jgi:predicted nucleotidyltransferase component of viral defense system
MIDLRPEDLLHKSHLNRLLMEVIDCHLLAKNLAFKGGSCAAMLGFLDRFSVDLDFDLLNLPDEGMMRKEFHRIFEQLGLEVAGEFDRVLFFQLKYPSVPGKRNSLKISCNSQVVRVNEYKAQYLPEIDRMMTCQTLETMVANKLVAITDRYAQHHTIAGRDIYDIHFFLVHGYSYNEEVVRARTGLEPKAYLEKLVSFIRKHVTQTIINEDLNTLLPPRNFQQVRKVLIPETIYFLERLIEQENQDKIL